MQSMAEETYWIAPEGSRSSEMNAAPVDPQTVQQKQGPIMDHKYIMFIHTL